MVQVLYHGILAAHCRKHLQLIGPKTWSRIWSRILQTLTAKNCTPFNCRHWISCQFRKTFRSKRMSSRGFVLTSKQGTLELVRHKDKCVVGHLFVSPGECRAPFCQNELFGAYTLLPSQFPHRSLFYYDSYVCHLAVPLFISLICCISPLGENFL